MKIPESVNCDATVNNGDNRKGLNGLVNGVEKGKSGRKKNKVVENHRKDDGKAKGSEISGTEAEESGGKGTKPKKKNKGAPKQNDTSELTKLDLCSIINRSREPIACSSKTETAFRITDTAVNTETLIDDLKDLNIDTELSDIAATVTGGPVVEEKVEKEAREELPPIDYVQYESELQMPMIMKLIQKDLSEPYSIYTYRYFIHNWPKLCFLVRLWFCKSNL